MKAGDKVKGNDSTCSDYDSPRKGNKIGTVVSVDGEMSCVRWDDGNELYHFSSNLILYNESPEDKYIGKVVIRIKNDEEYTVKRKCNCKPSCIFYDLESIDGKLVALKPEGFKLKEDTTSDSVTIKGENKDMNSSIVKLFPKTEEAVLVDAELGDHFTNPLIEILAVDKTKEILTYAKKVREDREKHK